MVRIKHRYLLLHLLYPASAVPSPSLPAPLAFHAPTPDTLTPALLARLIRDTVAHLFGDHGAGLVAPSLKIMYLSCPTSTAIVRVAREQVRLVWAALTMVGRLPGEGRGRPGREVVISVVRVSGTVRKCEEEVVRRGLEIVRKARRDGGMQGLGTDGDDSLRVEMGGGKSERSSRSVLGEDDVLDDPMSEDDLDT